MSALRPLARSRAVDVVIVVAALASALGVAFADDPVRGPRSTPWFAVPASALVVLPLLARRRRPFAAPASVWVLAAACSFVDGRLITFSAVLPVVGLAASFLLGQLPEVAQARIGLGIVVGAAAVIAGNDPNGASGDVVFSPVLFGIAWLAGYALRERAERVQAAEARAALAEREREAAARIAVAEERARIARELHDIVAHSVSVIVLQVGAVRHHLPATLAEEKATLEGVERTGRTALTDMRRLLGAMRRDGDGRELAPQPGLDRLEPLLEEVRRAGLAVHLDVRGDARPLPRALELSAYRVVQEGLTNALKHARARRADVVVHYAADELRIDVRDDGDGATATDGLGHGLVGVRERVNLYGGDMRAGAADGGGFLLTTTFPIDAGPV